MSLKTALTACLVFLTILAASPAQADAADYPPEISGEIFISYQNEDTEGDVGNRFLIKRGYINIKRRLGERLTGRVTPDISVDREGDGEGDLEMRFKYCYIDYSFADVSVFDKPHVEVGLVHRPWLDFEQSINRYRIAGLHVPRT